MSIVPATTIWFIRHELMLAWREWLAMMTGGQPSRRIGLIVFLGIVTVVLHLIAYALLAPWVAQGVSPDKTTLVMLTGCGLLFWTVMLSQALEAITRVYYARSDLDLILSSPASARRLFAVRTGAVALSTTVLTGLLASPLINILGLLDGSWWFTAYGVIMALGASATAVAMVITIALFRLVGPRQTRFVAQIVAAIVGAGFIIGIQAAAIFHFGSFSRFTLFQSEMVIALAPDAQNFIWWPARAAMGEVMPAGVIIVAGVVVLAMIMAVTASSYGYHAIAVAGLNHIRARRRPSCRAFIPMSQRQALRRKEWRLLQRDPWLVSQTLMQILYLLPPALLLWLNYGEAAGTYVVIVPVLVMAAGQLAGGLAWLAISGEDVPDLIATAPLSPRTVLQAKIEAVLVVIILVLAPLLVFLAFTSLVIALVTALCAVASASSATAIQLWFRVIAKRSMFRRRQVASRAATLSEAFASIMWAGAGALLATGAWIAILPVIMAVLVLLLAKWFSPR